MIPESGDRIRDSAVESVRGLFLRTDNYYGCAETALVALQERYGFENASDSSPAMALNGGIAYSGGTCGAILGAAMAVGRLAEERICDHGEAKSVTRQLLQRLMADFETQFGAQNCSDLIDYDIAKPSEHVAFIESGIWRETCMSQIEFSAGWLWRLADIDVWDEVVETLDR